MPITQRRQWSVKSNPESILLPDAWGEDRSGNGVLPRTQGRAKTLHRQWEFIGDARFLPHPFCRVPQLAAANSAKQVWINGRREPIVNSSSDRLLPFSRGSLGDPVPGARSRYCLPFLCQQFPFRANDRERSTRLDLIDLSVRGFLPAPIGSFDGRLHSQKGSIFSRHIADSLRKKLRWLLGHAAALRVSCPPTIFCNYSHLVERLFGVRRIRWTESARRFPRFWFTDIQSIRARRKNRKVAENWFLRLDFEILAEAIRCGRGGRKKFASLWLHSCTNSGSCTCLHPRDAVNSGQTCKPWRGCRDVTDRVPHRCPLTVHVVAPDHRQTFHIYALMPTQSVVMFECHSGWRRVTLTLQRPTVPSNILTNFHSIK